MTRGDEEIIDDALDMLVWQRHERERLEAEVAALTAEIERLRELMKGPAAWLDSWATHVGNCQGGYVCTCGLVLARSEARAALGDTQ